MDSYEILKQMTPAMKAALVCGKDFWHSHDIASLQIPALTFSDGPSGLRYQAQAQDHLGIHGSAPATCFASASTLANSWDKALCYRIGKALGQEARWYGVDVLLAPGVNIIRNPRCGRAFEYYSEDPVLTGILAGCVVEGIQEYVSACLKHFALNSQESQRMLVDEQADEKTFQDLYLPAFERIIAQAHPDWIMTSYNKVDGIYANENPKLLKTILRKQLGFQGAVLSDWGGSHSIIKAIQNGSSLEMPSTFGHSQVQILEALESGLLKQEDLDERVLEILRALEAAHKRKAQPMEPAESFWEHHHRLAVEAALESAVLLKNDDGLLPLHHQKVLFVGPFSDYPIQGDGSSKVRPFYQPDFEKLLRQYSFESAQVVQGYDILSRKPNPKWERQALKKAKQADVICFLASLPVQNQLEGIEREATALPEVQLHLLEGLNALNKPIVLIDAVAGSLELPALLNLKAILYTGLAGQGALEALLALLSGRRSPNGRLAQTFARQWSDHPSSKSYPARNLLSVHEEGLQVGYRYFQNHPEKTVWPFGFGLSYTTFSQAVTALHPTGLDVLVCNTGQYSAAQTIQLYIQAADASFKELRGFAKVHLRPQESRRVFLGFDEFTFVEWSEEHEQRMLHPGRYTIEAALSSTQSFFCAQVEVDSQGKVCWLEQEPIQSETGKQRNPAPHKEPVQSNGIEMEGAQLTPAVSFKEYVRSSHPLYRHLARGLVGWKEQSLKRNQPAMAAIALCDMPLEKLVKINGNLVSEELVEAMAQSAQNPSWKHSAKVIGSLIHLPAVHQEQKRRSNWKENSQAGIRFTPIRPASSQAESKEGTRLVEPAEHLRNEEKKEPSRDTNEFLSGTEWKKE